MKLSKLLLITLNRLIITLKKLNYSDKQIIRILEELTRA